MRVRPPKPGKETVRLVVIVKCKTCRRTMPGGPGVHGSGGSATWTHAHWVNHRFKYHQEGNQELVDAAREYIERVFWKSMAGGGVETPEDIEAMRQAGVGPRWW